MNYDYALSINSTGVNLLCSSLGWAGDPYAKPICRGMGSRLPQNHPQCVIPPHSFPEFLSAFDFPIWKFESACKKIKKNKTHSFRFPQNFSLITQTSEKLTWNFKSKWFGRSLLTVSFTSSSNIYIKLFPFLSVRVEDCEKVWELMWGISMIRIYLTHIYLLNLLIHYG